MVVIMTYWVWFIEGREKVGTTKNAAIYQEPLKPAKKPFVKYCQIFQLEKWGNIE